ncbi:isonitrile hydratase [Candidatus Phycosocius bacilliformis]|uniref:Isonitrile hydratase n=1 Tax=Candidatus Phycosocius bacilliformis TaxID=1445552 RepID=A0A2P2ECB0_9PROT|nr:DJ-1/PfpI family protein [Candidatus Phycosocius bacilliformis]GBF58707.1 isonitrile hydratase [Candidatus Phycosocius bacilliformis]
MFQIGFILFPNVTQLDFTGPLQVLHRLPDSKVHIISASLEPVPSDCGLSLVPTTTFADCPQLDLICVPGGFGVEQAMADPLLMGFLKAQAAGARYVTSVCTGAFVLGAAGLLKGKQATTHWAYHPLLAEVGAIPTQGRTVRDGRTFTGGGVTAGIDFALTIVAEIAGQQVAQRIQLAIEYDPAPPFVGGSPASTPGDIVSGLAGFYAERNQKFGPAVTAAFSRFAD